MGLIRAKPPQAGYLHVAGPGDSELRYITFGLLALTAGGAWEEAAGGRELLLVILGGSCDIAVGGSAWRELGQREDVFGGKPTAVYAPPGETVRVTARNEVEIAVCGARAERGSAPAVIAPEDVGVREVGAGPFARTIHDLAISDDAPPTRLIVGETYNAPGGWSGYPPHRHERHHPPEESKQEELYHFRVNPRQGFGIQRIYGERFDETFTLQDRDTVTIAEGFHPVVAAPGYTLYYLWMLAGEERVMHPREDAAHAWVADSTATRRGT